MYIFGQHNQAIISCRGKTSSGMVMIIYVVTRRGFKNIRKKYYFSDI
jgi:hypothetical protein